MKISSRLQHISILVDSYEKGIVFFTEALGFELLEDVPSLTNDGRAKRWVVVAPPGGGCSVLLAQADGERQKQGVGDQFFGRVGLFLRVEEFHLVYQYLSREGVKFLSEPREESYGWVAVFEDPWGNKWDLLG